MKCRVFSRYFLPDFRTKISLPSLVCCCFNLKLIVDKHNRFNKKMSLLGSLLKHCAPDLAAFSLMYGVAFAMFVQVCSMEFGAF